jgi:hypothetical protein
MGRGTQDGNPVSGSIENTTPHHPADGRRWGPDASHPSPLCKEGASVCEEHYTSISELSGLETHPGGGPSGRFQRLGYLPRIHPVSGATSGQNPFRHIVSPENSRGGTVGGGTVPTRTHSFTPRTSDGMESAESPHSRSTEISGPHTLNVDYRDVEFDTATPSASHATHVKPLR